MLVAKADGVVVGVGVLDRCSRDVDRIVRMSVATDARRRGVGSLMLDEILRIAWAAGFRRIELETTATWTDAVAFYAGKGFVPTKLRDGDQHFAIEI